MVRAEDQTIFGSVNEAKTAECRVWQEPKVQRPEARRY